MALVPFRSATSNPAPAAANAAAICVHFKLEWLSHFIARFCSNLNVVSELLDELRLQLRWCVWRRVGEASPDASVTVLSLMAQLSRFYQSLELCRNVDTKLRELRTVPAAFADISKAMNSAKPS